MDAARRPGPAQVGLTPPLAGKPARQIGPLHPCGRDTGTGTVSAALVRQADTGGPVVRLGVDLETDLPRDIGRFDFFLDVGCFQGLNAEQRVGEARSLAALAGPGATLLLMAFGPTRLASVVGGVSRDDVEEAFRGWEMVSVEPADTTGLG